MSPKLVGLMIGGEVDLPPGSEVTIGRDPSSTFHLSPINISRRHAVIETDKNGQSYFLDVGSKNGSRIGIEKCVPHERYLLENGAMIILSHHSFEYVGN